MKPKVFIGSSTEALGIANATQSRLQHVAHATVWSQGVFGIGQTNLANLLREARDSDFGIFVLQADDVGQIRNKILRVPRDNVVFELGLFSGAVGSERCFFLVPSDQDLHLLSDLLGITPGTYDATRPASESEAAVGPVCEIIGRKIREAGVRSCSVFERITGLAGRYEECESITNQGDRIRRKDELFEQMKACCADPQASKRRLACQTDTGFYVAFAAATLARPEIDDADLLLRIPSSRVRRGNSQHKMVDAIQVLRDRGFAQDRKSQLIAWLNGMDTSDDPHLTQRISQMSASLRS